MLERISILKNIPYCAFCTLRKTSVKVENAYSLNHTEYAEKDQIILSGEIRDRLEKGAFVLSGKEFKKSKCSLKVFGLKFEPAALALMPTTNRATEYGLFLFADDDQTADRLSPFLEALKRIVEMTSSKLENIFLVNELKRLNEELEHKVKQSTQDLTATNKDLQIQIQERGKAEEAPTATATWSSGFSISPTRQSRLKGLEKRHSAPDCRLVALMTKRG